MSGTAGTVRLPARRSAARRSPTGGSAIGAADHTGTVLTAFAQAGNLSGAGETAGSAGETTRSARETTRLLFGHGPPGR